jgi:hypothetical protein
MKTPISDHNSILGRLNRVDVDVEAVSEVYTASIFRAKVFKVGESVFQKKWGRGAEEGQLVSFLVCTSGCILFKEHAMGRT